MKTLGTVLFCALTACAIVPPQNAVAQDTHYWSNQYGPKSMLLSGAVIGSVHDMSATFYNPGALGYIDKPDLLLSANAYQMTAGPLLVLALVAIVIYFGPKYFSRKPANELPFRREPFALSDD